MAVAEHQNANQYSNLGGSNQKTKPKEGGAIITIVNNIVVGKGTVHQGGFHMKGTIIKENMVHHRGHPKKDHLKDY